MKTKPTRDLIFKGVLACTWVAEGSTEQNQSQISPLVETRIGELESEHGVPTEATVTKLYDELDFQRSCQAYLWALPLTGFAQLRVAMEQDAGAGSGDIVNFEGYRSVMVFLTANATTPYTVGFLDLKTSGPMVVDVPAGAIAGSAMDFWQRPLTDFGVTGPDEGKSGKFLFVGPGQEVPKDDGYFVFHSPTFQMFFFYRALDADPQKAKAMKTGVRTYSYAQRDNPPDTKYLTPRTDKDLILQTQPRGLDYWKLLAQVIDYEPVEERDRFFLGMLRPLGIEKGQPFAPDERQKKILIEGALVGEEMAKANSFDKRFAGKRYREDASWDYVILADPAQDLATYSQLDERAAYTYEAVALSKGMVTKTPGVGQAYLASYRDKDGSAFDGAKTYKLHVSPNPPAKQFWSVTVYDVDTRCLIQNKEQIGDRSSRQDLVKNADGSVDIYFGPAAPAGYEKNWIPTVPGRAWFTYLRLYAPLQPYFDKSWPLPDIELMK